MSVDCLTGADRAVAAVIDVVPEFYRKGTTTVVGFTASARNRGPFSVQFELENLSEPSDRALTEAMMIASVALGMQQQCALRIHGNVARSLRHTIDLYQEACAWWWPQRYRKVPIEVGVVDDQPPATTRGILCFSGGVDSIFSARRLGAARQIEAGLLVEGYDIDLANAESLRDQRARVERLLGRLGLATVVIRTNARDVLGQEIVEGAQGSYLAAALNFSIGQLWSRLYVIRHFGSRQHWRRRPCARGCHSVARQRAVSGSCLRRADFAVREVAGAGGRARAVPRYSRLPGAGQRRALWTMFQVPAQCLRLRCNER